MGNASSNPVRNMDKRTARREYKEDFVAGIEKYRKKIGYTPPPKIKKKEIDLKFQEEKKIENLYQNIPDDNSVNNIKVFIRKRPIFQQELDGGEFDVVSCLQSSSGSDYNKIIIHDARMHVDMIHEYLHHHSFSFDGVFHENKVNEEVYNSSVKPLVNISCGGGYSTALVYGQTGSGKTYTMSSFYQMASKEIFSYFDQISSHSVEKCFKISVNFVEILGDTINDLLNGCKPVNLATCSSGAVIPYPVIEPEVNSPEELYGVISHAINVRSTAATGVHDGSSRSHSILTINIQRLDLNNEDADEPNIVEGSLMLVDLAGSEHRIDSMFHGKERRKETSHINSSLSALKECIRMRAMAINSIESSSDLSQPQQLLKLQQKNQHLYRKSKLTLALKSSLFFPSSNTVIIACVSPSSKDTEHSLNTLRHANLMKENIDDDSEKSNPTEKESSHLTGGDVKTEKIGRIDINLISKKNAQYKKNYGEFEELKTNNGNQLTSDKSKKSNNEVELSEKEKKKLKRMAEMKSFNSLSQEIKDVILNERKSKKQSMTLQSRRLCNTNPPGTLISSGNIEPEEEENLEYDIEEEIKRYKNEFEKTETSSSILKKNSSKIKVQNYQVDEEYEDDTIQEEMEVESPLKDTSSSKEIFTINNKSLSVDDIISSLFIIKDSVAIELILKQIRRILQIMNFPSQSIDEKIRYYFNKYFANDDSDSMNGSNRMIRLSYSSSSSNISSTSSVSVARSRKQVISIATTLPKQPEAPHTFSSYGGINAIGSSQLPSNEKPTSSSIKTGSKIILKNNIKNKYISDKETEEVNSALIRSSSASRVVHTPPPQISRSHIESQREGSASSTRSTPPSQDKIRAAREKLEYEANLRKNRQNQAKMIRLQQETQRNSQRPKSSSSSALQSSDQLDINEEIIKLTNQLEQDKYAKGDEKLSLAQKFALKKQLALHKATILKAQRPTKQSQHDDTSYSSSTPDYDPNDLNNPFVPRANIEKDVKKRYHNDYNYEPNSSMKEDIQEQLYVSKSGRLLNSKNINDLKARGLSQGYEEIQEERIEVQEEEVYDPKEHFKSVSRSEYGDPRFSQRNYY